MKTFNNLQRAFQYQIKCPLCSSFLSVDCKVQNTIQFNLTQNIDSETDDILSINIIDNKVSIDYYNRNKDDSDDIDIKNYKLHVPTYNGNIYESVEVFCINCWKYDYRLKVQVDLTNLAVVEISLNSESINILDRFNTFHQINNNYSVGNTIYKFHRSSEEVVKEIILPLIDLDLNDPILTLERLQKLTTFI